MKYHYKLVIEDTGNDIELLVIKGQNVSKSLAGCYKAVKRDLTQSLKEYIDKESTKCPEGPNSKNG